MKETVIFALLAMSIAAYVFSEDVYSKNSDILLPDSKEVFSNGDFHPKKPWFLEDSADKTHNIME